MNIFAWFASKSDAEKIMLTAFENNKLAVADEIYKSSTELQQQFQKKVPVNGANNVMTEILEICMSMKEDIKNKEYMWSEQVKMNLDKINFFLDHSSYENNQHFIGILITDLPKMFNLPNRVNNNVLDINSESYKHKLEWVKAFVRREEVAAKLTSGSESNYGFGQFLAGLAKCRVDHQDITDRQEDIFSIIEAVKGEKLAGQIASSLIPSIKGESGHHYLLEHLENFVQKNQDPVVQENQAPVVHANIYPVLGQPTSRISATPAPREL